MQDFATPKHHVNNFWDRANEHNKEKRNLHPIIVMIHFMCLYLCLSKNPTVCLLATEVQMNYNDNK